MKSKSQHPRVFWILKGSFYTPSSRIHGYRVHEYLKRQGWFSRIVFQPYHWMGRCPLTLEDLEEIPAFQPGDVVIFQKTEGGTAAALIEYLRKEGIVTVYLDCDMPLKLAQASAAQHVVCSSAYLAEAYRTAGIKNPVSIPDAVEHFRMRERTRHHDKKLRCVWFGSCTPDKRRQIKWFRELLKDPRLSSWEFMTVSQGHGADMAWNPQTVWEILGRFDAAVLPSGTSPEDYAKSANRLTQAMALRIPTVVSPIPAYASIIENGVTGFLCDTDEAWVEALVKLTESSRRAEIARRAFTLAYKYYSMEVIGQRWTDFLERISPARLPHLQTNHLRIKKLRARAFARMAYRVSGGLRRKYLFHAIKEWPTDRVSWNLLAGSIA